VSPAVGELDPPPGGYEFLQRSENLFSGHVSLILTDVVDNATRGLGGFYVRIAMAFGWRDRGMT
jgi:hypothetical protein